VAAPRRFYYSVVWVLRWRIALVVTKKALPQDRTPPLDDSKIYRLTETPIPVTVMWQKKSGTRLDFHDAFFAQHVDRKTFFPSRDEQVDTSMVDASSFDAKFVEE